MANTSVIILFQFAKKITKDGSVFNPLTTIKLLINKILL